MPMALRATPITLRFAIYALRDVYVYAISSDFFIDAPRRRFPWLSRRHAPPLRATFAFLRRCRHLTPPLLLRGGGHFFAILENISCRCRHSFD